MISILHLSDIHIVQSAQWNNIRASILEEAWKVHDRPRGEKLLVLTGDYHNFSEGGYEKAKGFLDELFAALDIDPTKDVFTVPGNHDVGSPAAMGKCFPGDEDWDMRQSMSVEWLKNHNCSEKGYNRYLRWRMESYLPYRQFLSELGIYPHDGPLAASPHVRCWRDKLNLLHLNTTLIADGSSKENQRVDLLAATDEKIWEGVNPALPALALGHNNFYDLEKAHQEGLIPVFLRHGVCAYLCGDTHKKNLDRNQKRIFLTNNSEDGNDLQIPNVVGIKGAADESDNFSDFGLYWHCWDTELHKVDFLPLEWKPDVDQASFEEGKQRSYPMPRGGKAPPAPIPPKPPIKEDISAHLADIMTQTRKNHPSFKLMQPDELDPRLFPRIEALGKVGESGVCPVWELIVSSWREGRNRSIVLTGEGGIGKTVALLSPEGAEAQSVPALYVPLFELVEQEKVVPIETYLQKRLRLRWEAFEELAEQKWEKKPSFLLLLDGVNELPARYRFDVIHNVNDWARDHGGVQLVAVSRPLDGLNLGQELANEPISIQLSPLKRDKVSEYLRELEREIPAETDPIWKVLVLPLFLVLYAKTGKLEKKSACGYPLNPKPVTGGGALIWNYLQRELLRKGNERWVLECAVACEYLLPAVGYEMVKNHRFTIHKADLDRLLAETLPGLSEELPNHLRAIFDQYDNLHDEPPAFDGVKWRGMLLHELGLLTRYKGKRNTFAFLHQHFRDAFAGLYLVNAAEAETVAPKPPRSWNAAEPKARLPELWKRSQPPLAMEYAAQLMEEGTAKDLWEALHALWPKDQKQQAPNRAALYTQLELHRRRDALAELDFSGMDLRGISLFRYRDWLFQKSALTRETKLDEAVFQGVGHSGPITCVAVYKDDRIISGSKDRTLCIWDTNNGMCLKVLSGHTDEVTCVAVLNDGRIVSGGFDNTIMEWDTTTGENRILLEQIGLVTCLAEASENKIVIGRKAKEFLVWDLVTGQSSILDGIPYWSTCVTVLDDGRLITGSYGDHSIKIWEKGWEMDSRSFNAFYGHQKWVYCVTAIGNNQVASGSQDNIIQVWNTNTRENKTLIGHNGPVTCIVKHGEDGIISGSRDDTILHWNIKTETSRTIYKHSDDVNCIALLDDERIVSGFDDGTLLVIDVYKGTCLQRLGRKRPHILNCSISPNGDWATAHSDGTIRLWSRKNICCTRVWMEPTNRITCIAYLKNEKIVGGLSDNTIRVWDFSNDGSKIIGKHSRTIRCIVQLRNEKIASGSDDKTIKIIDLENYKCEVLPPFDDGINSITEVDDERLVVGLRNNSLWVCNIQTGFRWHLNERRPSSFNTVVLLKNGQLASGSNKGKIKIWDTDKGELYELSDYTKAIFSLLELGNGRLLSASRDSMIRVWDLDSRESKELKGHTKAVTCIIRLDDSHVVSGSYDCTLRVWDVDTGKCLAIIPVSEMDVTGLDLRDAKLEPDAARLLYYNGAKVPELYADQLRSELAD